jgi:putative ABC transport system substrate-binding protein
MRRRHLFGLLAGITIGGSTTSAQQPPLPTVGVLVVAAPGWDQFWRMFREFMQELG